ncbi:MAG: hypothetical protein EBV89_08525 [Betaproteobacteria bacterium]|nr:hypothetical protein [Betaproteobacteria bacterium]
MAHHAVHGLRDLLRRYLTQQGFAVVVAEDAQAWVVIDNQNVGWPGGVLLHHRSMIKQALLIFEMPHKASRILTARLRLCLGHNKGCA